MVQGIYDDSNPDTVARWAYKDSGKWDAERNTREFLAAMPEWRKHGLNSFTINLQGGSPEGYSKEQPWNNTAIAADGSLKPAYMQRLKRILDKADDLGMAVILGIFYFGQDERVKDEEAVKKAVDNTVDWVFDNGYRHVLIEVDNECNVARYDHEILKPARVQELIERVKARTRNGRRLLVSTSYGGGKVPEENVVRSADFLLLHGNGVKDPKRIAEMIQQTRAVRATLRSRSFSMKTITSISTRPTITSSPRSASVHRGATSIRRVISRHRSTGDWTPIGRRASLQG